MEDKPLTFSLRPTPWRHGKYRRTIRGKTLPKNYFTLIWRISGGDQVWLCLLSGLIAVLNTVPIEIQRRVVNRSLKEGSFRSLAFFVSAYAAVVLGQGLLKLLSNIYRSWVSEHGVRSLRTFLNQRDGGAASDADTTAQTQGTEISMVIAESEPIGAFVGESISEPLLQGGILLSVSGYLLYLQPVMAIVIAAVFAPQFIFVPLMQRAVTRRAQARIAKLREASGALVGEEEGADLRRQQESRFAEVFRLNMGVYKLKYTMNFLMNLCHQWGIAGVLGIGGWLVVGGKTEVGTIVAFISGLATIKDPWDDLATWFQTAMVTQGRYQLFYEALSKEGSASKTEGVSAAAE